MKNELRIEIILHTRPTRRRGSPLVEVLRVEEKIRIRRGRVSLTQYLESQEDHDMTRLLYFTKTQEKRREGGRVVCFGMEGGGGFI